MSTSMKSHPPSPGPQKNIIYPAVPEQRLTNGARILVIEDNRLPRIFLSLVYGAGRAWGPPHNSALLPLAVELIKSGTASRSATEISDLIDRLAIHYDNSLQMEHTLFSMTVLAPQLEQSVEILGDMIARPTFPEEEIEKTRVRWKSELIAQRSQPGFLANECTFRTFYPDHPYARVSTLPEDLDRAPRKEIETTYRASYGAADAYLLMAGAIQPERAFELGQDLLSTTNGPERPQPEAPPMPSIEGRMVRLVHRPHSVQSYILVSGRTLPRAHPEMIDLKVTNQILGGGGSARLFLNLREDKGFTYGAYSRLRSLGQDGLFLAGASVRTEVTRQAIQEVLVELGRLQQEPPDEEELERCRQELIGGFIRQMETPASVGLMEVERRLFGLPEEYFRTFIPRVQAVTRERVVKMARLFDPREVVITVVADRNLVEKELEPLGELQAFDVNGKPL